MSDATMREIFARNLKRLLEMNDKQPADIVRDLGIPFSTVSNWVNGEKFPRMGQIEMLANYLGVEKSDLLEDKGDAIPESYYLNDDARDLARFLFDNPDYKVLFDASRKVSREDLETVQKIIEKFGGVDSNYDDPC